MRMNMRMVLLPNMEGMLAILSHYHSDRIGLSVVQPVSESAYVLILSVSFVRV